MSTAQDDGADRCFFTRALATTKVIPVEVTTDKAAVFPHVLEEIAPGAWHCTQAYATDEIVNREHSARWDLFSDPFLSAAAV